MKYFREMIGFALLSAAAFSLTGCGKTTVNLDKYISITVDGYNTLGTAAYEFDYEAFDKDYSGKIKLDSKDNENLKSLGLLAGESSEDLLLDLCVSMRLDQTYDLSNGDTVTLTWDCQDSMAEEYFNVKLDYSDISLTVKGLEEAGSFDPFEYLSVSFSGVSPEGTVEITPDYDRPEIQYVNFTADRAEGLSNGDQVTVTASISGSYDSFVENYGVLLSQSEKSYTVEGLAHYISDLDDVPKDIYDKMDKQLQDSFNATVASKWNDDEKVDSFTLVGNYLLTLKKGMQEEPNNRLYYVYKVSYSNSKVKNFEYYWYGSFDNIMILADGTCTVNLSKYTVPEYSWWGQEYVPIDNSGYYYVEGFSDLDSFFNEKITSQIECYEYEKNIQE